MAEVDTSAGRWWLVWVSTPHQPSDMTAYISRKQSYLHLGETFKLERYWPFLLAVSEPFLIDHFLVPVSVDLHICMQAT